MGWVLPEMMNNKKENIGMHKWRQLSFWPRQKEETQNIEVLVAAVDFRK